MFIIREFHICCKDRGNRRCLLSGSFTCVTRRVACKVFVIIELHICNKERMVEGACHKGLRFCHIEIMVGVCYKGDSCLLQGEVHARSLSYKSFTSVTMREEWNVCCEIDICYKETMEGRYASVSRTEGIESICCKRVSLLRVSQLLQREWERKAFGLREFHMLQGQGETGACHRVSHVWEIPISFKDRGNRKCCK